MLDLIEKPFVSLFVVLKDELFGFAGERCWGFAEDESINDGVELLKSYLQEVELVTEYEAVVDHRNAL